MTTELTLNDRLTINSLPQLIDELPTSAVDSFLGKQRWYGETSRPLRAHRVIESHAIERTSAAIVLLSLSFEDGESEVYLLLLAFGDGEPDERDLALVRDAEEKVFRLYDAGGEMDVCSAVFGMLASGSEFEGAKGTFAVVDEGTHRLDARVETRPFDSEHSNTAFIAGESYFVKVIRRVPAGPSPEIELNRFLRTRGEYARVPALVRSLEYQTKDSTRVLMIVHEYVESEGSTWGSAVASVRQFLNADTAEIPFESEVRQIGDLLGNLHLALASNASDVQFAPEPIGPDDWGRWRASVISQVDRVAKSYEGGEGVLAPVWEQVSSSLRALGPVVQRGGMKLRPHGDFHLNQLLRTEDGWAVLDFEGEPNRPLDERRAKESPLRDAAMMLRSLHYAAYAALVEHAGPGEEAHWPRWHERADSWYSAMRRCFLDAYYEKTAEAEVLPPLNEDRDTLLRLFELERALVDLDYNLNSRPEWVTVDLNVIKKLLA